ncbi:MAG: hypothetical protein LBR29_09485, partial [Methylobacteriaceae bacterium]|jgi:TPR repeat protein|nr:hypothetical protein [Methylobacteriaceae bacterium]
MAYAEGRGVRANKAEAVKWLKKAAEQNYSPAREALERISGGQRAAQQASDTEEAKPERETGTQATPPRRETGRKAAPRRAPAKKRRR